jgi:hypothetical protein
MNELFLLFYCLNVKIRRFFLEKSEKLLIFLANPYLLVIIAANSKEIIQNI